MATLSKAFGKVGPSAPTSKAKLQESPSMTMSLLKDASSKHITNATIRKTHRRIQSNDSTDSSIDGYIMKTGKLRRKLQWRPLPAVKDLLAPTSSMTIDGEDPVASPGGTCVTESTSHSFVTQPNNGSKRSLGSIDSEKCVANIKESQKQKKEKATLSRKHPPKPRKQRSKLVKLVQIEAITKDNKEKKTTVPLPPRVTAFLPNNNKCRLAPKIDRGYLERQASDPTPVPQQQQQQQDQLSPMTTPAVFLLGEPDFKDGSPLTPIAPTQLLFDSLASPNCSELNESMMLDHLEFPDLQQEYDEYNCNEEDDESSCNDYSLCSEFGIILCPYEDLGVAASPLTPSPTIRSPPLRQHSDSQGPSPFELEKVLSESKKKHTPKENRPDKNVYVEVSTKQFNEEPKLPDRRTMMMQFKGTANPSSHSMRNISRSIPVDLDEGTFVDARNNLQAIEEMASEHVEHGEYEEAVDVYRELLRGRLEEFGYEHEAVGMTLHKLASIHMKQNDCASAVQVSEKAVSIRKLALGVDNPEVAVSLVQLGLAHFEQQDYKLALSAFQEALAIRRRYLGSKHLKVAKVLNNIGCTQKQLSNSYEAIRAFEEALKIQKQVLASVSLNQRDPECKKAFHQLSLEVASSLSNICTVKLSRKCFAEALRALEEALEVSFDVGCIVFLLKLSYAYSKFCLEMFQTQMPLLGHEHPEVEETLRGIDFIKDMMKHNASSVSFDLMCASLLMTC